MAKKKKTPKPESSQSSDAPAKAPVKSEAKSAAEIAFEKGNFAAVHALAKSGDEAAQKLLPLTTIDMKQVAAGIIALAVTLTIAIFTLGH